jgi:two-component system phosphate regulon sensor histidine kinase PhoR
MNASERAALRGLIASMETGRPLRIWAPQFPGSANAYAVAICALEAYGPRWREVQLDVFATHEDADALVRARAGHYSSDGLKGLSAAARKRFFVDAAGGPRVALLIRRMCRFLRHDFRRPPPFSRIDLIVCGDSARALSPAARKEIFASFHSALAPGGLLLDRTGHAAKFPALFGAAGKSRRIFAAKSAAKMSVRRTHAEDARLQASEERFRAVFSQTNAAMLVRDVGTDRIVEANEAAERLYGWSHAELLKMRGADLTASSAEVRLAEGERRSEERLSLPHHRRKNARPVTADIQFMFFMLHGRPSELWTVLDAAPRLKGKSGRRHDDERNAFVGEVIHELRSPLAVIQCFAETLRSGSTKPEEQAAYLEKIEKQTGRMALLIDRLLDLSSAHSGKRSSPPAAIPLAESLWDIVSAFAPIAKKRGVAIKIDVAPDLAVLAVHADLPHVFGNLIDNAIKFNRQGGRVEIRGRAEDGEAVVTVRDTGLGIPAADLNKIFERFYRSERTRTIKGTGLGLTIVRGIVEANGGRIWVTAAPDSGTIFHVSLPLAVPAGRLAS